MEDTALEAELKKAAVLEVQKIRFRQAKLSKTKGQYQREMDDVTQRIDEVKRKYRVNPALREIESQYAKLVLVETACGLVCPECGEGDKGNKMNGKPWCFKCNAVLVPRDKVAKLSKNIVKGSRKTLADLVKEFVDKGGKNE